MWPAPCMDDPSVTGFFCNLSTSTTVHSLGDIQTVLYFITVDSSISPMFPVELLMLVEIICSTSTWRVSMSWRYPLNHPKSDHDLVLKPMVIPHEKNNPTTCGACKCPCVILIALAIGNGKNSRHGAREGVDATVGHDLSV